jgi:hypothetical protein
MVLVGLAGIFESLKMCGKGFFLGRRGRGFTMKSMTVIYEGEEMDDPYSSESNDTIKYDF